MPVLYTIFTFILRKRKKAKKNWFYQYEHHITLTFDAKTYIKNFDQ